MGAAYSGSLPTVMHLLARGADIHATDSMGCSALHFASNRGMCVCCGVGVLEPSE